MSCRFDLFQCYRFDPELNSWTQFADMLDGVDHAAAGTDGIDLYIFGGRSTGRNAPSAGSDKTQVYTVASNSWSYGG